MPAALVVPVAENEPGPVTVTVWLASGLPPRVTVALIEPTGIVRVTRSGSRR